MEYFPVLPPASFDPPLRPTRLGAYDAKSGTYTIFGDGPFLHPVCPITPEQCRQCVDLQYEQSEKGEN